MSGQRPSELLPHEVAPCTECKLRIRCGTCGLACREFMAWTNGSPYKARDPLKRNLDQRPSARVFDKMYGGA